MIILFPKNNFYILHWIFYILHFHRHEGTNFFTAEGFATKTRRHKVSRRMSFNSVVDSYFAKGLSIFIHERMIILFPKYHFYILHWIFYILHFHRHECTNFYYRGGFCHEGTKAQSFRNRFHAKLARGLRREGFVFISPFGGLRGHPLLHFTLDILHFTFSQAQSFQSRFHAKLARGQRREDSVTSPFGGLRGLTFFYSLFLLSYYLFQSV